MNITRRSLEELASELGFAPDALEKVMKLITVLKGLADHRLTKNKWVLKGGTALNLLHLEVPRLSVDIDINFIGSVTVEELNEERDPFERAVTQVCREEQYSVRRLPIEHAGGKLRLRYQSALGGERNLEVDLNYVQRVPLYDVSEMEVMFSKVLGDNLFKVPTLSLEELAAGKFAALTSRCAPRDLFDAKSLLDLKGDLVENRDFRICFICFVASARKDFSLKIKPLNVESKHIEEQLLPLLRVRRDVRHISATDVLSSCEYVEKALGKLYQWSSEEKKFLQVFFEKGEIEPEYLTNNAELQQRILKQPMLLWKQKHIRAKLK